MIHLRRIACLMLVSAMLTACGSGGGSGAEAASDQIATPVTGDLSSNPDVNSSNPHANPSAKVAQAVVSWSAPTQREDGSEFTPEEIARYEIYHIDDTSGDMDIIEVAADSNEYRVALASGSHELSVAVVDIHGVESRMSEPQTVEVD